ncbi:hypothetical protein [Streptomyces reniochalinae]|uniref:Uncharacterized protein n=1 Tax=Streptomyces reniochalinae TaxID=2250578 RepID=A0A367F0L3_9ACTN|nr:hypothetical protein [Streptomyces reniochalinae]RCG23904.1 hypothetical protein DQ392_04300 [Streptomyces reniochalinae]
MARDSDFCLDVPEDFDDADDETGVYPIAKKLILGATAADVFRKAHEWVRNHDIRLTDVSWDHMCDEDQPYVMSMYFTFELDSEPDPEEV